MHTRAKLRMNERRQTIDPQLSEEPYLYIIEFVILLIRLTNILFVILSLARRIAFRDSLILII